MVARVGEQYRNKVSTGTLLFRGEQYTHIAKPDSAAEGTGKIQGRWKNVNTGGLIGKHTSMKHAG